MSTDSRRPLFIFFRPMVEVDGETEAIEAAAAMQARLKAVPGVASVDVGRRPRPYWKFDGTWEVTFHLHLRAPLAGVFQDLMDLAPTGWIGDFAADTSDGARWAAWNRPDDDGAALLRPDVVWAELSTWDGVVYTGPFESADD